MKRMLLAAVAAVGLSIAGVAQAASSPTVATGSTSSITTSSAVLHGTVNPDGAQTGYEFQWGLTTQYGLNSSTKTINGTKNVSVSATASNLLPGTVYHYRLVALNKFGGSLGSDHTFKTAGSPPPDAATGPPFQVGTTTATISAVINPHGAKTTWAFQVGTSAAYEFTTVGGSVSGGSAPVTVAQTLTGLAPGTTFHYRIVAEHSGSVVATGADATFVTEPSPRPVARVGASTSPRRDSKRPYTFTTSGRVIGSSRFPASLQCTGNISVRFLLGRRSVASALVPLQPNCTFSTETVFKHLPGRRHPSSEQLQVSVRFLGNGYLAPARARTHTVQLG